MLSGSMASFFNLSSSVEHLYMQKNALSESIPNAFFGSFTLVVLDLRDNKLSGSIPNQIDDKVLNPCFLLLEEIIYRGIFLLNCAGLVPNKGQFVTFVESCFGDNPGLYGPHIKRSCGSCEPTTLLATPSGAGEEEDESAIHMVSFY
ncbi:hypothetical protein Ddye_002439 [Dipteronia dyeriana]|uniref:Uncharacterized protein n=1 Tax=Dipteronia dyeriana TaxID=168575 RepID=A0AAE0CUD7_9ROSI|nr:hypothetical protein Ddye_002439 [Dipteronia dyeriana]